MHVSQERLRELAGMSVIVDQPEWQHIKQCKECGRQFVELLEDCIDAEGSKPQDS